MDIQISRGQKNVSSGLVIKLVLVVVLLSTTIISRSQTQFILGGSLGYNKSYHQFDFMPRENSDVTPDYNFGVDGIMKLNDWLRVKAEVHYSNMGFTRHWNTGSTDPLAIDVSKVALSNLDISPMVDLRFLNVSKFDVYATLGFCFEFQMGKYERDYQNNGLKTDYDHIMDKYNESKSGVVGGLLFKYNLNKDFALTLSPRYTYFFNPFVTRASYEDSYKTYFLGMEFNKINLRRTSVNIGLEWNF